MNQAGDMVLSEPQTDGGGIFATGEELLNLSTNGQQIKNRQKIEPNKTIYTWTVCAYNNRLLFDETIVKNVPTTCE